MLTETDIKSNWYYFCSLTEQLQRTTKYVDHDVDAAGVIINGTTFSYEFAKILMLSASEFEVVARSLCAESGLTIPWNANIVSITKAIINAYPHIGDTEIMTPFQILKPLDKWSVVQVTNRNGKIQEKVIGIDWWEHHNKVKHSRYSDFPSATLQNCIFSMASLAVMELYLSQKVLENVDFMSATGCEYFDFEYGQSRLLVNAGHRLPDFL